MPDTQDSSPEAEKPPGGEQTAAEPTTKLPKPRPWFGFRRRALFSKSRRVTSIHISGSGYW